MFKLSKKSNTKKRIVILHLSSFKIIKMLLMLKEQEHIIENVIHNKNHTYLCLMVVVVRNMCAM